MSARCSFLSAIKKISMASETESRCAPQYQECGGSGKKKTYNCTPSQIHQNALRKAGSEGCTRKTQGSLGCGVHVLGRADE